MDPYQQAGYNMQAATVNGLPLSAAFPNGIPAGSTINGVPLGAAGLPGFQGGASPFVQPGFGGAGSAGPEWTNFG